MAILTNFAIERLSSRWGYRACGNFDKSGEFGENGDFDEILPKIDLAQDRGTDKVAILTNPANSARMAILTKFRQRSIELKIGIPTKRRF